MSRKGGFAIAAAPGAGDVLARRLVMEAETGIVLEAPTAADAERFSLPSDSDLTGLRVVTFLRDPWSRVAHVYRDAIVRRSASSGFGGFLDAKHRMIQVSGSPFAEVVKLLSLLKPDVLCRHFAPQPVPLTTTPSDVVVFDPSNLRPLAEFVASVHCPETAARLTAFVAADEIPPCMMRVHVGAVKPAGFDRCTSGRVRQVFLLADELSNDFVGRIQETCEAFGTLLTKVPSALVPPLLVEGRMVGILRYL